MSAQLGMTLVKKGLKEADVATMWDRDRSGTIEKKEFRKEVLALGVVVEGEPDEIDTLFDAYDVDRTGSLGMAELRKALKSMRDEVEDVKNKIREMSIKTLEVWRDMKHLQTEYKMQQKADEEAEAAEEAASREREAEEAAAAEAVKAAKLQADAEKKRREAEKKAAFEAKIAAKRAGEAGAGK